ncbi:MAG TPA: hypothetical protein VHD91_09365 [Gaiellaceae bacterium]|nr:hypothetical protein [Gaiellaceae bacterium]
MLEALERPARGEPAGALVLLHGRGADERDLFPLLDAIDPERRLHGFTPRAPLSLPPGGAHWYSVPRVGFPDPETFAYGYGELTAWLDALPFPPGRMLLGGFSQGAVMSYASGLGAGRPRPAAIAALSGFLPEVESWSLGADAPFPPVYAAHGVHDDVIPIAFGRQARDRLAAAGAEVDWHEFPGGHWVDPASLPALQELAARLG